MKKTPGILINGDWLKGEGSTLRSFSPVDGSKVWKGNAASAAEVRAAVTAARKAQPGWAALPLSERVALVERFASLLTERAEALATCISSETGKPLWEAATEVQAMINKAGISIRAQQESPRGAGVATDAQGIHAGGRRIRSLRAAGRPGSWVHKEVAKTHRAGNMDHDPETSVTTTRRGRQDAIELPQPPDTSLRIALRGPIQQP